MFIACYRYRMTRTAAPTQWFFIRDSDRPNHADSAERFRSESDARVALDEERRAMRDSQSAAARYFQGHVIEVFD
jgi:hypothetical protein